jgi:hypothetical protein
MIMLGKRRAGPPNGSRKPYRRDGLSHLVSEYVDERQTSHSQVFTRRSKLFAEIAAAR